MMYRRIAARYYNYLHVMLNKHSYCTNHIELKVQTFDSPGDDAGSHAHTIDIHFV